MNLKSTNPSAPDEVAIRIRGIGSASLTLSPEAASVNQGSEVVWSLEGSSPVGWMVSFKHPSPFEVPAAGEGQQDAESQSAAAEVLRPGPDGLIRATVHERARDDDYPYQVRLDFDDASTAAACGRLVVGMVVQIPDIPGPSGSVTPPTPVK